MKSQLSKIAYSIAAICCCSVSAANDLTVQPRIIHGEEVASVPAWIGKVQINLPTSYIRCGGSLIETSWVVTAAHCFDDVTNLSNVDGFVQLGTNDSNDLTKQYRIKSVTRHPNYINSSAGLVNDIALVELTRDANVAPISIASLAQLNALRDDDPVTVMGWGKTENQSFSDRLRSVGLQFLTRTACNQPGRWSGSVAKGAVCAYSNRSVDRAASCSGDSGGPLIHSVNGTDVLVGLVSYGAGDEKGNCRVDIPEVHTAPALYSQWITNTTKLLELGGKLDLGWAPQSYPKSTTLTLQNKTEAPITLRDVRIEPNTSVFQVDAAACGGSIAASSACDVTVSAVTDTAGVFSGRLVIDYGVDQSDSHDLRVHVLEPLQITGNLAGVSWYSNDNWVESTLGDAAKPRFTSAVDSDDSVLLAMVQGPMTLNFSARSLGGTSGAASFDGVDIALNGVPTSWVRLTEVVSNTSFTVPSGNQLVAFKYSKNVKEGSRIALFDFNSGQSQETPTVRPKPNLPEDNIANAQSSGGAVSLGLFGALLLGAWGRRRG